ncbi:MAG: sugar transferase [Bacteroidetes bacterium OLB9]|nr:MAG: sugar transferase [Bacteroidetes bacterium OLB9]MCZ2340014.1 sugar transferase [Chitinophagales bacterium]
MYKFIKRSIDFILSLLGILILIPLFIPIMVILRFTAEGEVFYRQERLGYKNQTFSILKFATMIKDSPNIGSKTITVRNDPRITSIGKWLRISKINELPQVYNVLKGEMALVGPRPMLITSFKKYSKDVQEILYKNRPGITGIGSLVFRDEEMLVTAIKEKGLDPMEYYLNHIYPYKGVLEKWYFHNISLYTDSVILLLTFNSLFNKNSNLVYKIFKDLPAKPEILKLSSLQSNS